jgi:iron complex outermembrane receptor protein
VPLSDVFSVIAGLRWTQDRNHIEINPTCTNGFLPFACAVVAPPGVVQGDGFTSANSGGLNRRSKGDWSGRLQANFRPSEDLLFYAGVTRGQKGGGFNAAAIAGIPASITPYQPEVLTNYEAGFKSTLLGGTTRFNGGAFYYDYKNYQAYTLTGLTPTIFNTDARVIGAELELQVRPVRGLTLSGGAAYLDAIAHDVQSNLLGTGVNLGDQHMPQSPKWSGNGLVRYEFDALSGVIGLQGDARYNSRRYFNTVNHPALADKEDFVVNARISYTTADDRWEFALWGRNLTNTTVYASGFDLAGTNGSTPLAVARPRWFGGSVRLRL